MVPRAKRGDAGNMSMNYTGLPLDCQIRSSYHTITVDDDTDVYINEVNKWHNGSVRLLTHLSAAVLLALSAAACKGISDPAANTNSDFTALLQKGGGNVHQFTSGRVGEYSFSILAMAPDAATQVKVYLGIVDGSGLCQAIDATFQMVKDQTTPLRQIQKGGYCVQITDPSYNGGSPALIQDETYTLRVSHP
jgi:hypothetical protein